MISNEKVNIVRVNGVNTAGQTAVSDVKGNGVTAGYPQQALKYKGIFDNGCSRHMTGNKNFLTDYQDIDVGFIVFGGSARGGKITGKGKIRTDKLDFEDVFFVNELKFNLFSVSQMCDKKNSVLFTKTECLVLSPNFKLLDESQVLLRVPRLGHVNFKTMNKLVKGNLVRGLPLKIFDNDHTCVACQKGKQHKASWNQTNKNAGPQEANGNTGLKQSVDARQSEEKSVSTQQYIMFPLWSSYHFQATIARIENIKNDTADDDAGESHVQKPASKNEQRNKELLQGKATKAISTNRFNNVSTPVNVASAPRTSNDAGPSFRSACLKYWHFGIAYNDDDEFGPYKFSLSRAVVVQRLISTTWNLQLLNPQKIAQALDEESWVEAMQEELLQFKIQKVWTLVDLPYGKKAIGTKWVYRNKKDKGYNSQKQSQTDSDYAGASLDRKSTTGCFQFLGSRLISWQCKKQNVMGNSTIEAEYIAASHCCGQVLWIQNQMLDYGYNFMRTKIHVDNESVILEYTQVLFGLKLEGKHDDQLLNTAGLSFLYLKKLCTAGTKSLYAKDLWSLAPRHHGGAPAQTMSERVLEQPNEPPLSEGGHTPGSDEGRLKLHELMTMCTNMSKQVLDLEKEKDAQVLEAEEESTMEFELIKFIKSMLEE
ncbi:ribonuclease H-like domain-containing protein [Tanacetum coccineum]